MTDSSPDPSQWAEPDFDEVDLDAVEAPAQELSGSPEDELLEPLAGVERQGDRDLSDILGSMIQEGRVQAAEDGVVAGDPTAVRGPPSPTQDDVRGLDGELVVALGDPTHPRHDEAVRAMEAIQSLKGVFEEITPEKVAVTSIEEAMDVMGARLKMSITDAADPDSTEANAEIMAKLAEAIINVNRQPGDPNHLQMMMSFMDHEGEEHFIAVRPVRLPMEVWSQVDEELARHQHCDHMHDGEGNSIPCPGGMLDFQVGRALTDWFCGPNLMQSMIAAADAAEGLEHHLIHERPEILSGIENSKNYIEIVKAVSSMPKGVAAALVATIMCKYLWDSGRQAIAPDVRQAFDPTERILTDDMEEAVELVNKRLNRLYGDDETARNEDELLGHLDFKPEEDDQ